MTCRYTARKPMPKSRFHRRERVLGAAALLLLALLGLSGCEETRACFPAGASCTDADAYSLFFSANVPCCEGTCSPDPQDPQNQAVRFCQ